MPCFHFSECSRSAIHSLTATHKFRFCVRMHTCISLISEMSFDRFMRKKAKLMTILLKYVCLYTTSTWHLQNCWVSNWSDKQNDETLLLCVMARLLNLSVGCGLRFDQWLDFYFYNSDNAIESFSSSDSGLFCTHSRFTWETVIKKITHIHKQMIKCHHQFLLIYLKCTACNKALPLPCSVCVRCNTYAVCNVR